MARTKVYFWLKIDKNFFSNIAIKRLRRLENGDAMTVLYIRMLLESTEDEGVLYFEGILSDLMEEVAEVLDADTNLVRETFSYFEKAKLLQIDEDGNAELTQFPELVGQETEDARKKRRQRTRQKKNEAQKKDGRGDIVPDLSQSVPDLSQSVPDLSQSVPTEEKRRVREEIEKSQRQSRVSSDLEKNVSPEEVEQSSDNQDKTATADPTEKEIKDILNHYQNSVGVINSFQSQRLIEFLTIDKMEAELIKRAINKSADNGKRNFNYVTTILRNWAQNGIKTIAQQDEEERNYTASKNKGKVAIESNSIFPDDIGF